MSRERHFRSSPRPQLTLQVTLRVPDDPHKRSWVVTTRDVSTGGIFVYTDAEFAPDALLEVDLATPSTWEPLTLKAKVCRVVTAAEGKPGLGLKFVEVSDTELVALIHLTTSLDFES